jgi:hypothetical protein
MGTEGIPAPECREQTPGGGVQGGAGEPAPRTLALLAVEEGDAAANE